jgi:hypothetical protein
VSATGFGGPGGKRFGTAAWTTAFVIMALVMVVTRVAVTAARAAQVTSEISFGDRYRNRWVRSEEVGEALGEPWAGVPSPTEASLAFTATGYLTRSLPPRPVTANVPATPGRL